MTLQELRALMRRARAIVNNLTLDSIVLNNAINNLLTELEHEDWVESNDIGPSVNEMSRSLDSFCNTLEKFQKISLLLAGGNDDEDDE